jgi:hypothetical protein
MHHSRSFYSYPTVIEMWSSVLGVEVQSQMLIVFRLFEGGKVR